jgi:hypothetical protein
MCMILGRAHPPTLNSIRTTRHNTLCSLTHRSRSASGEELILFLFWYLALVHSAHASTSSLRKLPFRSIPVTVAPVGPVPHVLRYWVTARSPASLLRKALARHACHGDHSGGALAPVPRDVASAVLLPPPVPALHGADAARCGCSGCAARLAVRCSIEQARGLSRPCREAWRVAA